MNTDVPLFDEPAAPPAAPVKKAAGQGRVTWARYRSAQPERCDDCTQAHTERPDAPLARQARWSRKQDGQRRLLCYDHAQQWRAQDGLHPLAGAHL